MYGAAAAFEAVMAALADAAGAGVVAALAGEGAVASLADGLGGGGVGGGLATALVAPLFLGE